MVVYAIIGVSSVVGTPFSPARSRAAARARANAGRAHGGERRVQHARGRRRFAGPAIGGFLVAATSTQVVFAVNGASFLWSAALVLGIRVEETAAEATSRATRQGSRRGGAQRRAFARSSAEPRRPHPGLAVHGQTLVSGALGVLVVVTAFDLLHGGPKQVGLLDAAVGVGGLLAGSCAALALAARGRIAADFALASSSSGRWR